MEFNNLIHWQNDTRQWNIMWRKLQISISPWWVGVKIKIRSVREKTIVINSHYRESKNKLERFSLKPQEGWWIYLKILNIVNNILKYLSVGIYYTLIETYRDIFICGTYVYPMWWNNNNYYCIYE